MATKKKTKKAKARPAKAAKKAVKKKAVKKKPAKAARKPAAKARTSAPAADPVRALARRIVALTMANDDEATFDIYAADVESVEMGQPATRGIDALRAKFAGWRSMTSEAKFEPKRVCVDGNTIVIEWIGHVTMAGTGKQAEMHEVAIHEIRDGKIAREAYFYNPAALS